MSLDFKSFVNALNFCMWHSFVICTFRFLMEICNLTLSHGSCAVFGERFYSTTKSAHHETDLSKWGQVWKFVETAHVSASGSLSLFNNSVPPSVTFACRAICGNFFRDDLDSSRLCRISVHRNQGWNLLKRNNLLGFFTKLSQKNCFTLDLVSNFHPKKLSGNLVLFRAIASCEYLRHLTHWPGKNNWPGSILCKLICFCLRVSM